MNKLLLYNKCYSRFQFEKGEKLLLSLGTHCAMSLPTQSLEGGNCIFLFIISSNSRI